MRLGELMRSWRAARTLSIREMSERVDIPISTLSRVENGKMPDAPTLIKLLAWVTGPVEAKA